jgi:hypothetical protein
MYPANAYVIREATAADDDVLRRLAEIGGQQPLAGRALIGEVDGFPAAAASLTAPRIDADPSRATTHLVALIGMRARAQRAFERTPSVSKRLSESMRAWRLANAVA